MGRRRQLVIGASVASALAVGAGATVLWGGNGHASRLGSVDAGSTTTTSTTAPTETTLALVPVTSASTTSTAPPPSTTSTTTLGPALSGQGAVLAAPGAPDVRVLAPGAGCSALTDAGGWSVQCGQLGSSAIWMTETRSVNQGATATRAYVFQAAGPAPAAPGRTSTTAGPATTSTTAPAGGSTTTTSAGPAGSRWSVALTEKDDAGSRFSGVVAVAGDVRGDGTQAVVFGFRQVGSAAVLSLDLAEVPPDVTGPSVTVHVDLAKGAARISTGQLDTWAASFVPGDATCCPSAYSHEVIHFLAGSWRVVSTVRVSPAAVPPSEF